LIAHDFILCSRCPDNLEEFLLEKRSEFTKIHDQFIQEYYEVFSNVKLFWNEVGNYGDGFCYYGISIITPEMAEDLKVAIVHYLKDNKTEKAEYFLGEELDVLNDLLEESVKSKKILLHFGI